MNRWLALAQEPDDTAERSPDTQPEPSETPFCMVSAGCRVGKLPVEIAPRPEFAPSALPQSREAGPYQHSVNGNPCTWTGRVVSLDEWRKLSEWERHGSTGKLWNGITGQWEDGGVA